MTKQTRVPTTVSVTRTFRHHTNGEITDREDPVVLDVHEFVTPPAVVKVEVGGNINLGNYESLNVSVGVEVPCYREEMTQTIPRAMAFVKKHYLREIDNIRDTLVKARNEAAEKLPF